MEDLTRDLGIAITRLTRSVEELMNDRQPYNSSASSINVNAGGIGVWVATTACIVMMAVILVGGMWMQREFTAKQIADTAQDQHIAELGQYLQAIYAQAPSLQPPQKKEDK